MTIGNAASMPLRTNIKAGITPTLRDIHGHPELHVTIGQDARSSGLTIEVWIPADHGHTHHHILYAARWGSPIGSYEECMQILYNGTSAALAELLGEALQMD